MDVCETPASFTKFPPEWIFFPASSSCTHSHLSNVTWRLHTGDISHWVACIRGDILLAYMCTYMYTVMCVLVHMHVSVCICVCVTVVAREFEVLLLRYHPPVLETGSVIDLKVT